MHRLYILQTAAVVWMAEFSITSYIAFWKVICLPLFFLTHSPTLSRDPFFCPPFTAYYSPPISPAYPFPVPFPNLSGSLVTLFAIVHNPPPPLPSVKHEVSRTDSWPQFATVCPWSGGREEGCSPSLQYVLVTAWWVFSGLNLGEEVLWNVQHDSGEVEMGERALIHPIQNHYHACLLELRWW